MRMSVKNSLETIGSESPIKIVYLKFGNENYVTVETHSISSILRLTSTK